MLLVHALHIFLMDRCSYCSGRTVQYYKENINRFLFYLSDSSGAAAEDLNCDVVNREVVQKYMVWLRQQNIKNTSVNTYFRAVKVFLNYCIDEQYVASDSLRKVKMLRSDQSPIIPLYQDEAARIDALFNFRTETYCAITVWFI